MRGFREVFAQDDYLTTFVRQLDDGDQLLAMRGCTGDRGAGREGKIGGAGDYGVHAADARDGDDLDLEPGSVPKPGILGDVKRQKLNELGRNREDDMVGRGARRRDKRSEKH